MSRKSKIQHRMVTALSGNILLNIYIIFMKKRKFEKFTPQPVLTPISVIVNNLRGLFSQIRSHIIAVIIKYFQTPTTYVV